MPLEAIEPSYKWVWVGHGFSRAIKLLHLVFGGVVVEAEA
jgi:hypothetical protein